MTGYCIILEEQNLYLLYSAKIPRCQILDCLCPCGVKRSVFSVCFRFHYLYRSLGYGEGNGIRVHLIAVTGDTAEIGIGVCR